MSDYSRLWFQYARLAAARIRSTNERGISIQSFEPAAIAFLQALPGLPSASVIDSYNFWLGAAVGGCGLLSVAAVALIRLREKRLAARHATKLGEVEARTRAILEASMDAVITMDHLGRIVEFNVAAEKYFGHTRQYAVGRDLGELLVPPELRNAHRQGIKRFLATGDGPVLGKRVVLPALRADGSRFQAEIAIVPIPGFDPPLFTATLRDITERQQAEALTQGQKRVLEMIASDKPLPDILATWTRIIEAQAPEMLGSILLLDRDGAHLRHGAAPSLPEEYVRAIDGIAIGASVGSCGSAAFRRERVVVENIAIDPLWADFRDLALQHGLQACWSTPILDPRAGLLGTFAMYYRLPGQPSAKHLWLIDIATQTAAIAINHHSAGQALRQAEERYRNFIAHSSEAIFRFEHRDPVPTDLPVELLCERIVTSAVLAESNLAHAHLYGYADEQQTVGLPLETFGGLDSNRKMVGALVRNGLRLDNFEWSETLQGQQKWFRGSIVGTVEGGLLTGAWGTQMDITEHKLAEQALRENMLMLENTFEHMDQGISIADKDLRSFGVNRRFRELLDFPAWLCKPGVPVDALLRYNAERGDYGPGDVDEQVRSRVELALRFEPHRFEHERPDGTILEIRGQPVPGGGFVTIYTDITQRARSERESQRFRAALNLSVDGIYLADCTTLAILDCNDGACQALGYAREELVGSGVEIIFADRTREQLRVAYAKLVAGDSSESSFDALHRRKDGTEFPVEINRVIHTTAQGPILVAVARDISERKHTEKRLAQRARQQAIVARLGQLALGKIEREPLFDAAMLGLRHGGADAAALFEFTRADGQYVIRAATGQGNEASIGQAGPPAAEDRWRQQLIKNGIAVASRSDLALRAAGMHAIGLPSASWVGKMGSGLYAALHAEEGLFGMLAVYSLQDDAFGEEDRRFIQTVGATLSTAMQRLQSEQRLAHLAQFDTLTGLPNRNLLLDRLKQAVIQASRSRLQLGVLFLDIDHFKLVNDSLGHFLGDRLIALVAKRIQACLRKGDTVGRISGDEFASVLPELPRADDAALVARKILDSFAAPFDLDGHETFVSASIGIAIFPHDDNDADRLLKDADAAMYRAKETGRDRFCFYTADLHQRSVAKLQLTNDLRRALERREYRLYYQPKIDLASGALAGLEALIRWQHPQRGLVAPIDFIPALEESGLIVQVGEWVIEEACAQLRRWSDAGLALVPIAVNVSPRQFRSDDLVAAIQRLHNAAGIAPGLIELEITESCLMDKPEQAIKVLEALSAAGLKLSIDDFGTGYSSLAYLTRFPLTALKIDRSFVRDLTTSADAGAIARAIIDMAHTLRFTVVAEGVETEEQAEFLRAHGCEQGQGYLFARPAPASEVVTRLQPGAHPAPKNHDSIFRS